MSLVRKLKPDRNFIPALTGPFMLLMFAITTLITNVHTGLMVLAIAVWLFGLFYLIVFIRTGNLVQLIIFADGLLIGTILFFISRTSTLNRQELRELDIALKSGILFFGSLIIYSVITRRFKWRGREIFELAGEKVEETGNGYTSRPRPVGKTDYSQHQIHAFARYCARHLIAFPYYTSKNITLVPVKMGDEFGLVLGLGGDYRDATWVNFDVDGEVSVHIAQKDYLDYREPLAFDQLCVSLGQVFIEFLDLQTKGEGVRVIDRLDDLKLGVLS